MLNPSWRAAIRRLAASLTHRPRRSVRLGRDWNLEDRLAPATIANLSSPPTLAAPDMPGLAAIDVSLAAAVRREWQVPAGTQSAQWVVGLGPLQDPQTVASMGATMTPVGFWNHAYVASFADAKDVATFGPSLAGAVDFVYPLIKIKQNPKLVPNDTLFPQQWHLRNTGQNGGTPGADIKAVPAWNSATGAGVVIGIVDDGLEHTHPDLQPNYDATDSYDFNGGDSDPAPGNGDDHGTAVAGVAAAKGNNNLGVAGVAFDASLAGLKLISAPASDADEANALTYHKDAISIYSNSWGPADIGTLGSIGPMALAALQNGYTTGRGGLGNNYTWAAGNGLQNDDNVNWDPYANSRYVIAVGSVDHNGKQAWYSEPGAPMLVTAYGDEITTTDRVGGNGYTGGDYTPDFNGTSAATPVVSGVIALMLQANPDLTSRDVQNILVRTARKNDASDPGWSVNKAGYHINHKYGFGAVDANAAVSLAKSWTSVPSELTTSSPVILVNKAIPDNSATGVSSSFTLGKNYQLEHVEIVFNATHSRAADLEIVLTAPSGTKSTLATTHANTSFGNYSDWVFSTVRNWGELSAGKWTLTVRDKAGGTAGTFVNWQLRVYGTEVPPGLAGIETTVLRYLENQVLNVTSTLTVVNNGGNNLTGAKVFVSGSFSAGEDLLSVGFSGGLTSAYDSNTGVLTINGTATSSKYQDVLRSVQYENLSENPAPVTKTVSFQINDANGNASLPVSRGISVTPVNDAPSFTGGPDVSVDEDSGLQTITDWATNILPGPPEEVPFQTAWMEIISYTNPKLYLRPPYVSATGTLTFQTALNASGTSTVDVRARDDGGTANGGVDRSAGQSFQIIVAPVNDPPVPQADQYVVMEDTTLTVAAPGVLGNDMDMEGDPLTAIKLTNPTHGTVTAFGSNGSFTYKPFANYSGTDSFTYKATDGLLASGPTTVTLSVVNVNDAPTAVDDNSASDGNPVTINVLGNDTDPDNNALRVASYTRPASGKVTRSGNALVYTPLPGTTGPDSFNYTVSDGFGGFDVGKVNIAVTDTIAPEVQGAKLTYGSSSSAVIDLGSLTRSVLPWANVTKFQFQFSEGVTVNPAALSLVGGATGNVTLAFSYDAASRTATWTSATALVIDRYTMQLDAALVKDASNNLMGANWAKAFAVLPGDFDGNGVVDDLDFAGIQANYSKVGKPVNRFADIDGSGFVDATDLAVALGNRSRRV
jgi:subtilisin-like proprotein convertase family protein